jgi:signal transduction histidine kinase
VQALAARTPQPRVDLVAADVPRLSPAVEATAYFVVAEALTNALKHAYASNLRTTVEYHEGLLRIDVTDDGVGGADMSAGWGLLGIDDRVSAVGGTLTLRSVPRRGTSVQAVIPCAADDPSTNGQP